MDKTEGSEQPKRPSARRQNADPVEQQPTAAAAKRVHARRANANQDVEDEAETPQMPRTPRTPAEQPAQRSVAARSGRAHSRPPRAPSQPSAAPSVVWHSDAAAPSREREPDLAVSHGAGRGRSVAPTSTSTSTALARGELSDEFGLDCDYEAKLRPWLEALCTRYFHVEVHGAQHVPSHGRALLVANHSRSMLWDGIILRTALRLHHDTGREARWLVDDQQYHAPFLGTFINRLGAVRACQENAERLLRREELVVVFPEGAKAAEKRYEERYRLQRFGRGGYVKLALRTGSPVLPVAIVATVPEERNWLDHIGSASRMLSAPLFALRPGFSRLGQLGVPPLASRVRIIIGEPVREIARQDAEATRDDGLVHELNEFVRGAVQTMVDENLGA